MNTHMFNGPNITPHHIISWRKKLVETLDNMQDKRKNLLINFSVNMPGSIKVNPAANIIYYRGIQTINLACMCNSLLVVDTKKMTDIAGLNYLVSLRGISTLDLKRLMLRIENEHPLGDFMNLSVIGIDKKPVSRSTLNLPPKRCLLCNSAAIDCERNNTHPIEDIYNKIQKTILKH